MESKETTHLLCSKSIYDVIRINGSKQREKDAESLNDNFKYYTVDPAWMNVRLFVFWFLWAMLIIVLIGSIASYCCFLPQTCTTSKKGMILNATST